MLTVERGNKLHLVDNSSTIILFHTEGLMIMISRILLMINVRLPIGLISAIIVLGTPAFAIHPLITDDTGTKGKGKFEVELEYQHDHNAYIDNNLNIYGLFIKYITYNNSVSGCVNSRSDIKEENNNAYT